MSDNQNQYNSGNDRQSHGPEDNDRNKGVNPQDPNQGVNRNDDENTSNREGNLYPDKETPGVDNPEIETPNRKQDGDADSTEKKIPSM